MKFTNKILAALAVSAGFLAVSCEDQPDAFKLADGVPVVHYVRPVDVNQADSLLTGAYLEANICLVGENLRSVHQIYFNDKKAVLNTSYMTDNTLIVAVPNALPGLVTDKMYLINKAQDTVKVDFQVLVPPPAIKGMSCEWAAPGSVAKLYGDYFVDDPAVPFSMVFAGAEVDPETVTVTKTEVTFTIPQDAVQGETVEVTTVYGTSSSSFQYKDTRGMLFDFDGEFGLATNASNCWHGRTFMSEGGISGNYVILNDGLEVMSEDGGWKDGQFAFEYWCGDWNTPQNITSGPGIALFNLVDFTDFQNMSLKFEMLIPSANKWSAGAMQIAFEGIERLTISGNPVDGYSTVGSANAYAFNNQNNDKIKDYGGEYPRAIYRPWLTSEDGSYHTEDQWVTVSIPFTDFKYDYKGGEVKGRMSSAADFGSMTLFVVGGGTNGVECTPVFKIDNIRAVSNR
jgi:hypothetical protein